MEDINGAIIGDKMKPALTDRGVFEGLVEFDWYLDAVEYLGQCFHCKGHVGGVLRIEDPKLKTYTRTHADMREIKREIKKILQARHQCSFNAEGKTDMGDWLKGMQS